MDYESKPENCPGEISLDDDSPCYNCSESAKCQAKFFMKATKQEDPEYQKLLAERLRIEIEHAKESAKIYGGMNRDFSNKDAIKKFFSFIDQFHKDFMKSHVPKTKDSFYILLSSYLQSWHSIAIDGTTDENDTEKSSS